jgi:hypothetical protein
MYSSISISLFCILLLCVNESAFGWVSSHQNIGRRPFSTSSSDSSSSLNMGVTSAVKRVRDSILSKERSRKDLKIGIAGFYDRSSKLWEDVWGEVCKILVIVSSVVCLFHSLYLPLPNVSHSFRLLRSICTTDIIFLKIAPTTFKLRLI